MHVKSMCEIVNTEYPAMTPDCYGALVGVVLPVDVAFVADGVFVLGGLVGVPDVGAVVGGLPMV